MADTILPSDDEIARLTPARRSITRRRVSDGRLFANAGYVLLLQVAHPTVGAGVAEHSDFQAEPWVRLLRTLDFVNGFIYGDPATAGNIGRAIRGMHTQIKGLGPDGARYHALEPEAYAWVHATLFHGFVSGHERFGRPFSTAESEELYGEWRGLGRLLGVRERDLPEDFAGFGVYFDTMVRERLTNNETVQAVLETLVTPASPPLPPAVARVWPLARVPLSTALRLATVGMLPPLLRDRFGLRWTRANDLELRAIGAVSRAATPLLPKAVRISGPGYLKWRADEIAALAQAGERERDLAAVA